MRRGLTGPGARFVVVVGSPPTAPSDCRPGAIDTSALLTSVRWGRQPVALGKAFAEDCPELRRFAALPISAASSAHVPELPVPMRPQTRQVR